MRIINWQEIDTILKRQILNRGRSKNQDDVVGSVTNIVARIRAEGDRALLYYTERSLMGLS